MAQCPCVPVPLLALLACVHGVCDFPWMTNEKKKENAIVLTKKNIVSGSGRLLMTGTVVPTR